MDFWAHNQPFYSHHHHPSSSSYPMWSPFPAHAWHPSSYWSQPLQPPHVALHNYHYPQYGCQAPSSHAFAPFAMPAYTPVVSHHPQVVVEHAPSHLRGWTPIHVSEASRTGLFIASAETNTNEVQTQTNAVASPPPQAETSPLVLPSAAVAPLVLPPSSMMVHPPPAKSPRVLVPTKYYVPRNHGVLLVEHALDRTELDLAKFRRLRDTQKIN
jgi:hypothetical protein